MNWLKKIYFVGILVCLINKICWAQQNYMQITGTVVNSKDKSPLAGATVYLSNTTIGTVTSNAGTFTLENVPLGKYELVVSYLGFETLALPISGQNSRKAMRVEIHQKTGNLKEVTVRARRRRDKNRKNYFELFKRYFLGTDENASKCIILNPKVLSYNIDIRSHVFTAFATEPLVINNEALGYRIYYDLQSFSFDFKDYHIAYFGYPRFEYMVARNQRENMDWENNRMKTYLNSIRYFLLLLKARQLKDKGFEVNKLIRVSKDSLPPLPVYSPRMIEEILHGNEPAPAFSEPKDSLYPNQEPYDSIIGSKRDSNYVRLKFNYSLRVLIPSTSSLIPRSKPGLNVIKVPGNSNLQSANAITESGSSQSSQSTVSILTMVKPDAYIDPNGVLTDPLAVSVEGAWAHMQVADLLPFDYRLPE